VKQLKVKVSGLVVVLGAMALLVWPGTALAHERRTIGNGQYDVVVGWSGEPAYVGQMNSATIRIMNAGTTTPVTGADKSLKLAIRQGASTQAFPLKAAFGQDGYYTADIMPTRAGDYQWTFTGDIGGTPVNETFDTADGKFNAVQPPTAVQFPVQLPDPAAATAAVQSAQADAQGARTLALVAIAVGILGLLLALAAVMMSGRQRRPQSEAAASASTRPASERI
jgi:hypothetical protein